MLLLAFETSCDETSAAVVEDGRRVRSLIIASSSAAFTASGGVIPEEAARRQVECILPVLHQALAQASVSIQDIDALAVTRGPGLLGSLLVGTTAARALARLWKKPLIGVHHTLGHLSSPWLELPENDEPTFPVLTLSASGGHTDLWLRSAHTRGRLIGRTRDDAAGEAFDKGASLLGLPYPGGPSIAKAAEHGNPAAFSFPLPLKKEDTLDFSFSGLKTALRYTIRDLPSVRPNLMSHVSHLPSPAPLPVADLAASFQAAIVEHTVDRLLAALAHHPEVSEVHVVGGVSANTALRLALRERIPVRTLHFPQRLVFCTDNAAMIGAAAEFLHRELGERAFDPFTTEASLPLGDALMNCES